MPGWTLTHRARSLPALRTTYSCSVFCPAPTFRALMHSGITAVAIATLLLGGCGSGGGGGGGSPGAAFTSPPAPAQYSGLATAALLTSQNAEEFASNVLGATEVGGSFSIAGVDSATAVSKSADSLSFLQRALDLAERRPTQNAPRTVAGTHAGVASVTTTEELFDCEGGGTVRERHEFDDVAGTSTQTQEYWNCLDAGELWHGTILARTRNSQPGATEIEIPALRILSDGDDETLTGTLQTVTEFPSGSRTVTVNLVIQDHVSRDDLKTDDFQVRVSFPPNSPTPMQNLEIIGGRLYLAKQGYVDLHTASPLVYPGFEPTVPESGGPIFLVGAAGAQIVVTPRSTEEALIGLDSDGDGIAERFVVIPYSLFDQGTETPARPVARIAGPATVPRNVAAELDGSGSTDANHDLLSFSWVIEAAPAGSVAQLDVSMGWNAKIVPDREGQYRIALTVSDGVLSHKTVHLFDATNVAPVASATVGEYRIATVGEVATLDDAGSNDANGDPLSFAWSIRSRPAGSLAVIQNPGAARASFAPDRAGIYEFDMVASDGRLTGTTTIRIAATSAFSAICNSDELDGIPDSGFLGVPTAEGRDFSVGLCSGWILVRDGQRNGISIRNIFTGREKELIALSSPPEKIAYDRTSGLLYVSYTCTTSLSVINLSSRAILSVPVPGAVVSMAPTGDGHVFVSYESSDQTPLAGSIVYINGASGTVEQVLLNAHGRELLFDQANSTLISNRSRITGTGEDAATSCREAPPGTSDVTRYKFANSTLVEEQSIPVTWPFIRNVVSADGEHGIFTHGTRLLEDRAPSNFSLVQGRWDFSNGDYPQYATAAAFQPLGRYVAIVVGYDYRVELFGVATHARATKFPVQNACSAIIEMDFSPGSRVLYGRSFACSTGGPGFEDRIHWWTVTD